MDGSFGNLKLYPADAPTGEAEPLSDQATPPPGPAPVALPDPFEVANRELIRPPGRRVHRGEEPFSAAWFDELEQKRYVRHGRWLPHALEFGRHPGESVLVLGAGAGSDAAHYQHHGSEVTVGVTPADHTDLIRRNLSRHGLASRLVPLTSGALPFPVGAFDVAVVNGLHGPAPSAATVDELYRVLKAGGKVIGLFPARYDAGFWQDLLVPLQWVYWRRPADPTTAPKTTARELRRVFARFADHRVSKRHLRRAELPHLWRILPLALLERLVGRVLVLKAFKPLSAARVGITRPDAIAA